MHGALASRGAALCAPSRRIAVQAKAGPASQQQQKPAAKQVNYGQNWYEATRQQAKPFRTVREEIEYRREANRVANGGKERKDLYSDNWDGDKYKGSSFNILTVIALVSILTPLLGLIFAYQTFGVLWG